jgi:hypothetical protein
MNCDEAFDALTDSAQLGNSALEWHLEFCPRCREMREVLAPALALLTAEPIAEETAAFHSPNRLPGLFGEQGSTPRDGASRPFLTPEAVHIAEQTARTLHPARRFLAARWTRWAAVSAACLLAALGWFFTASSCQSDKASPSAPVMLADQCLWMERTADNPAPPPEPGSSRWVVLSCVSCHLENSME